MPTKPITVTPCMGVWIEINERKFKKVKQLVTPCMGVWIEIPFYRNQTFAVMVTPCMGVWIEIPFESCVALVNGSHSLYGSVD